MWSQVLSPCKLSPRCHHLLEDIPAIPLPSAGVRSREGNEAGRGFLSTQPQPSSDSSLSPPHSQLRIRAKP